VGALPPARPSPSLRSPSGHRPMTTDERTDPQVVVVLGGPYTRARRRCRRPAGSQSQSIRGLAEGAPGVADLGGAVAGPGSLEVLGRLAGNGLDQPARRALRGMSGAVGLGKMRGFSLLSSKRAENDGSRTDGQRSA